MDLNVVIVTVAGYLVVCTEHATMHIHSRGVYACTLNCMYSSSAIKASTEWSQYRGGLFREVNSVSIVGTVLSGLNIV